jgi:WD40 repeat protein
MTCIRSFAAESDCLVAAESIGSGGPKNAELLCIYDLSRLNAQQPLQPLATYDHHTDLVTCVSTSTSHPQLFASGSRDCTVRLWDLRHNTPVGLFSAPGSGGYAHSQMVTSLDVVDNLVVSAGQDAAMCIWDIRMLGGAAADGGPGPVCAMQVSHRQAACMPLWRPICVAPMVLEVQRPT